MKDYDWRIRIKKLGSGIWHTEILDGDTALEGFHADSLTEATREAEACVGRYEAHLLAHWLQRQVG